MERCVTNGLYFLIRVNYTVKGLEVKNRLNQIVTQRLNLCPMTEEEIGLLMEDIAAFETRWGCRYRGEPLDHEICSVFRTQRELLRENPAQMMFNTLWLMLLTDTVIGSLCFKGLPDEKGRVEIGYGIAKDYEGQGYTTEAVAALCRSALEQPEVTAVIAETEKWNVASQRILDKCGLERYDETASAYWWELRH